MQKKFWIRNYYCDFGWKAQFFLFVLLFQFLWLKSKLFVRLLVIWQPVWMQWGAASHSDSSRLRGCQILQVNKRQMCGDSTALIRPNQCHTVTTGQLEASLVTPVATPFSQDQSRPSQTLFQTVNHSLCATQIQTNPAMLLKSFACIPGIHLCLQPKHK